MDFAPESVSRRLKIEIATNFAENEMPDLYRKISRAYIHDEMIKAFRNSASNRKE